MKTNREPSFWILWATGVMMVIAMGIFIWSIVQSSREGARITASESPRTGGGIAAGGYEALARVCIDLLPESSHLHINHVVKWCRTARLSPHVPREHFT